MKKLTDLESVINFIKSSHQIVDTPHSIIGYSMLKRPNEESRIIFEQINGFKISDFSVRGQNICLRTIASGFSFKGNVKLSVLGELCLQHLSVINVYESHSEFLSNNAIDFTYVINNDDVKNELLFEWIGKFNSNLLAQWLSGDESNDRILKEIRNKKIKPKTRKRYLDMSD